MSWKKIRDLIWKYIKEECYCWSGNKFNLCCKNKEAEPLCDKEYLDKFKNIAEKSRSFPSGPFLKLWRKISEERCLSINCENQAINSHLISNNILKKVFNDSKMQTIFVDDIQKFIFKERWVNEIKTFVWWCWEHDNNIFSEIDNNFFDSSKKHIILYTLRAFWYEARTKQNALRQAYSLLYHNIDSEFLFFIFLWTYSWYSEINKRYNILEYYNYKGKLNRIKSHIFLIKNIKLPIFVSSVFQLSYDLEWNVLNDLMNIDLKSIPISFNIISTEKELVILYSCIDRDYKLYSYYIEQLEHLYINSYDVFLNVINNIIYYYCENVILSKDFIIPSDFKMISPYETDFKNIDFKINPIIKYIS